MDSTASFILLLIGAVFGFMVFLAQMELFSISKSLRQLVATGHLILEELRKQGTK